MTISHKNQNSALYIFLNGDMDEYSANKTRKEVDDLIDLNTACSKVVINLAKVNFMDSTGIGFLIGRYKKLKRFNIDMFVEKPNFSADKVLNISGVYSLIPKI